MQQLRALTWMPWWHVPSKWPARYMFIATLDTLEYLRRGGRIGGAAALAGTMLRIKPMVYVAGGTVSAVRQT